MDTVQSKFSYIKLTTKNLKGTNTLGYSASRIIEERIFFVSLKVSSSGSAPVIFTNIKLA